MARLAGPYAVSPCLQAYRPVVERTLTCSKRLKRWADRQAVKVGARLAALSGASSVAVEGSKLQQRLPWTGLALLYSRHGLARMRDWLVGVSIGRIR
jgi:hypothetical protein